MALHNYWWLLIWIFLFGGISLSFIPLREEIVLGERCARWSWLSAILLSLPYVMWAGWRSYFGDTELYRRTFRSVPVGLSQVLPFTLSSSKDRAYALFEVLFKTLVSRSDIVFFLVIAAIQMFCLLHIYRKYSRNYWLSMFLFVASTDYLSWMHNGMRQFIAVVLIFVFIPLIVRKKYISMILVVLIASQFHLSALIFLPFIFIVNGRAWNIRTLLFIVGVVAAIFFLDRVTGFITSALEDTAYEDNLIFFDSGTDDGTNIFRVLFYSVPAFMAWIYRPYIDRADDPMINVCANLSVVAACFYVFSYFTSGIIVGRLPIYFSLANYILIPWLIDEVFDSESALLIDVGFVGVYSAFFFVQGKAWGIL